MKILPIIIKVIVVAAVIWAAVGLLLIGGMSGREKVVRELPSPSGDVTAIQTYQSGFADDSADVYLKRGRFTRKQRLGSFAHIIDAWWESSPDRLFVKHTYVFQTNDKRVHIDSFDSSGSRLRSELVGHYTISLDGSTSSIVPLEEEKESQHKNGH